MRRRSGGALAGLLGAGALATTGFAAAAVPPPAPARSPSPLPAATATRPPERPAALKQLLVLLMTHPTEKHEGNQERISYILNTPDFKTPAMPGRRVDEKDPRTYAVERASVALVDKAPFALGSEQIGTEDSLIIHVYAAASGHMQWHVEDKGAKGPAAGGTDAPIPFFGRDPRSLYREYLDLILTSLKSSAKSQR
jgi:hypothetical protein